MDEVAEAQRKLHNQDRHNFHSSLDIVSVMDGACCTHGGDKKCTQFWLTMLKGRDHTKNLGVDENNIKMGQGNR